MPLRSGLLLPTLLLVTLPAPAVEPGAAEAAVDEILSSFHAAAAEADGSRYFALLSDDAVYIGTDASERWTKEEFRAFADPYFSRGRGWTYTATERHVVVGPDRATAWFDELLWNEVYGTTRGTGVVVLTADGWRIAQYHLAIPIPNELARRVADLISAQERPGSE
jgi:ketosteroid isomerase-like protein